MANRIIKHYNQDEPLFPNSVDKSKSINELNDDELYLMAERLRRERDLEDTIKDLRRNSGERWNYDNPPKIDTQTPINQLYHHGILKQKWGVRRFQNEDGSLTAAGKARYGKQSEDYLQSRKDRANATEGLSNAELRRLNERLQLEKTYSELTTIEKKKNESYAVSLLKKVADKAVTEAAGKIAVGLAAAYVVDPMLKKAGAKK